LRAAGIAGGKINSREPAVLNLAVLPVFFLANHALGLINAQFSAFVGPGSQQRENSCE